MSQSNAIKPHTLWAFKITGKDESELHGRQYRVLIKKLADKAQILGSVRNIKYKPQIEVRLDIADKTQAEAIKKQLEDGLKSIDTEAKPLEFGELCQLDDDIKYEEFSVIREDELTEMVWALQGAGEVFYKSSKDIRTVMVLRDTMKERGLLGALKIEVGFIINRVNTMINDVSADQTPEFNFVEQHCLKRALVEPAWIDDKFMQLTNDLFYKVNRSEKAEFASKNKDERLRELQSLKDVAIEYQKSTENRIKYLDEQIDTHIKSNK